MKIYTNVDLRYNEIQNARIQTNQPQNPKTGTIYYNQSTNVIMYYTGPQDGWIPIGGGSPAPPGGGQENVLEQVGVSVGNSAGTNLTINQNKAVKLNFSSAGDGVLRLKDGNNNNSLLGTLTISGPEITINDVAANIGAVGYLPSGHSTYLFTHKLGTNNLIVQIIDSKGSTVICDVTRYSDGGQDYIRVDFSDKTVDNFIMVVTGHPYYLTLEQPVTDN